MTSFSGRASCFLGLSWFAFVIGCSSDEAPPPPTESSGARAGTTGTAGAAGHATAGGGAGGTQGIAGEGGTLSAGAGGQPNYDASALSVERQAGTGYCRLSRDGRYLVVRLRNDAALTSPETVVEVATVGSEHSLRLVAPVLGPAQGVDLLFDRGPLVGFTESWDFTIGVDPDGEHGESGAVLSGQCSDHRSRAALGMAALAAWYDEPSGLWNGNEWWRGANMLEVTIDYSRQTGDPTYVPLIETSFNQTMNAGFLNDYYDDEGWWALTWIKAYDLSGDAKYLDMAKSLFDDMAGGWDDSHCGGGIYWRKTDQIKNAISNELFLTIAARLHLRTPGDEGPGSYLDWAEREWEWFRSSGMLQDDHQIVDGINSASCAAGGPAYTYNQGVIVGGLVDLWRSTNDEALLDTADAIAQAALELMTDEDGVFIEAVCDPTCGGGDGLQFKGVFARNLAYLNEARPLPAYQEFLIRQSDSIWQTSRNASHQFGKRWQGPFDEADASRQSSALDAIVGAVRAANLNLALGRQATGTAPCSAGEEGARAIDGSSGSKWCAGGASGQTLEVDLGRERYVVGYRLRHAGAGGESSSWNTSDFDIEISADGESWSPSVSIVGNTEDVTTHPIVGTEARYVRLTVNKAQAGAESTAARIYELEVFGVTLE